MNTNDPGREHEPTDAEQVYVAEDPMAPGTAWAAASKQCSDLESELDGWRDLGAVVRLVTPTTARDMMARWVKRDLSGARPMPSESISNEFAKLRIEEAEANARNYAGRVQQVLEEIRVAITDGDEQEALDLISAALGEEPQDEN